MHTFKFELSLRFYSKTVDPYEIYTQLGLEPKWQHKIGEPRMTPKGVPLDGVYDCSYCSFCFNRQIDEELHDMLDRILNCLIQHKDLFYRIRDTGGRSEFFVGWYSPGNTGDTFSYELLNKINSLRIDLALDVYGRD
jgi:Domain of unknown function (DUF4279)